MRERPRKRNGLIMDRRFLRTMAVTATLTAATSFAVYAYMLQQGSVEAARTYAFTVLVFAELFRAFGARSESKPVWRISLFSNPSLLIVVVASLALQIWSQHYEMPGRFLKTVAVPWADSLALLALGTLPLLCLEIMKVARRTCGAEGTSAETASRRAANSVGEK